MNRMRLAVFTICLALPQLVWAAPRLSLEADKLPGVVLDDKQAEVVGSWSSSTHVAPYLGDGYLHDENKGKGEKSVRYSVQLPADGKYEVAVSYTPGNGRASNVPIQITTADGEQTVKLNQRRPAATRPPFMSLGVFRFTKDRAAVVLISNADTDGYVIADGVQFLPVADDVALGPNLTAGESLAKVEKKPDAKNNLGTDKTAKPDQAQVASVTTPVNVDKSVGATHEPKRSLKKLTPADLDRLLEKCLDGAPSADLTDDEQFLRRATLDLIGRHPTIEELQAFLAEGSPGKRAAAIDRLLADERFGRNWADYWSDVISHRVQPPELTFMNYQPLKEWLAQELNAGTPWNKIVTQMLTATGTVKDHPSATFVAYHQSNAVNLASETTRIFLGVQIQCAECHDHPFDSWKQVQFHQMAAFFVRAKTKMPQNSSLGADITDAGKGEQKNPKDGQMMHPVVLTGSVSAEVGISDAERREALARWVTDLDNPWFDKAIVNRIWARLMGRGFCEPVDNIGDLAEHLLPDLHEALAGHFTASGDDIKDLYRLIMNSRAYQRRLPTQDELKKIQFAAAKTARLRGDEVYWSLSVAVDLPNLTPPQEAPTAAIRFPPPPKSTHDLVNDAFRFDPSFPPDMISRTMGQAMWMMNNQQLQTQVDARPESNSMLSKLLAAETSDRLVTAKLFQRVLARQPTEREVDIALAHVNKLQDRGAPFEDLLWSLLNSTEFTVKP